MFRPMHDMTLACIAHSIRQVVITIKPKRRAHGIESPTPQERKSLRSSRVLFPRPLSLARRSHCPVMYEAGVPDWGTYEGGMSSGTRHGDGQFSYPAGCVLTGHWHEGCLHGPCKFTSGLSGQVMMSNFERGEPTGRGVSVSSDGGMAWSLQDGFIGDEMSMIDARKVALGLGLELAHSPTKVALGFELILPHGPTKGIEERETTPTAAHKVVHMSNRKGGRWGATLALSAKKPPPVDFASTARAIRRPAAAPSDLDIKRRLFDGPANKQAA